jgi:hypothetical protein
MNLGTYKEAEAQFQQALIFTREHGTRAASLEVFFLLGKLAFNTGDYSLARQQYHESLAGALELDYLTLVAQNHDALGRLKMVQDDNTGVRERFRAALQAVMTESQPPNNSGLMPGRIPVLLACLASIAELFVAEGNMGYAALLALLITNHPASQAKVKERGTRLLNRLEAQLSANDLANIRPRSRPSDLDAVAAQILKDLESM